MHKISFTIVRKNKYKSAPWYIRVRETGCKPIDVNLQTTDLKVAETELMRVKLAASEGSSTPLDALSIRQKGLSEPVSKAGGGIGAVGGLDARGGLPCFKHQQIYEGGAHAPGREELP